MQRHLSPRPRDSAKANIDANAVCRGPNFTAIVATLYVNILFYGRWCSILVKFLKWLRVDGRIWEMELCEL